MLVLQKIFAHKNSGKYPKWKDEGSFMKFQEMQIMLNIIAGTGVDEEELENLTRQLRRELLELDIESVDFIRKGIASERTKSGDPIALGQLILTLAASGGVLVTLIKTLQSWLTLQKIDIEMDINGNKIKMKGGKISKEEEQRLLAAYIAAVTLKRD